MPEPVNIQVGGNVGGSIVVGDNNLIVNTNHGTIIYKRTGPQVRPRGFAPQPPRAPRGFVNRSAELQNLEAWIASNEIVLLHGPDGIGKSSLIKQAANTAAARAMPGGVIPLEPFDANGEMFGADDIIQKLFDALFESDPQLKVDAITARTYLSNTHPLILLDEVPLPQPLQSALPELFPQGAILMTADIAGAGDFQRISVGPLPRQESIGLLASRAGLEVNDESLPTLEAICERLGDVSLGVVITGNVIRETGTTPAEALQFLRGASAKIPTVPLHSTHYKSPTAAQAALDRAFSFAFSRLKPEEQKILFTAAITPGLSMTPEWLDSALGGVDASVFIERLKALELLFANSPRLRIQPGFRAAAQKTAIGLVNESDVYTNLIQFLSAGLSDPTFIADELGNLLGALAWAARHAKWSMVIRLGRAIDAYLTLNGLWEAWGAILGLIHDAAQASGDVAVQGWVLHQLGTRLLALGDKLGAENLLREALLIRQKIGDTTGAAYTLHNLKLLISPAHPPRVKPAPKIPGILIGATVVGFLLTGMAILLGLAYVLWFPGPTPAPPAPTRTPTIEIPSTLTPSPTLLPSITPSLTRWVGPVETITPTLTVTLTPTPPGGSGQIIFESMPDPLEKGFYILYVMDVDGSNLRALLRDPISASQPAWSPDGKMLAFTSRYNQNSSSQIYTANADGSNLQQITSEGDNFHPTWSPDGKQIAFVRSYSGSGSDMYVMKADGTNFDDGSSAINLTNSDGTGQYDYPEWSPDGLHIAYQAFWENNWEIFVINADDSSKPSQLTKTQQRENDWSIQPSWSPDGKQIAFASNRSGNWDIYVMGNKGGRAKSLTQDEFYDIMPDWSPNGSLVAFSSNRDGILQIYLSAQDGSGIKPITKMPGESSAVDWKP